MPGCGSAWKMPSIITSPSRVSNSMRASACRSPICSSALIAPSARPSRRSITSTLAVHSHACVFGIRTAPRTPRAAAAATQRSAALGIERLIDRLVGQAHRFIIGEVQAQATRDLLGAPALSPRAILPGSLTPSTPGNIWTRDAPVGPLHRPRKPGLDIGPQLRIHRELRRLGTLSATLSMPPGGRGSILNAATSDRRVALQLSGDRRRRPTEPTRDLSHPATSGEQDRDLLSLGEGQIAPDTGARSRGGIPPPLRNHRTPMLGNTPASTAAFSLDAPRAIASQNRTRCSRRPAGGCPPQRVPAAAARLHARFLLGIATPDRQALRQPVESTPSSPGHTPADHDRPRDSPRKTLTGQAPQPN